MVGVNHQADGIGHRSIIVKAKGIIVFRLKVHFKPVKHDIGGVANFLIRHNVLTHDLLTCIRIAFHMLIHYVSGRAGNDFGMRIQTVDFGVRRDACIGGVLVIQIVIEELVDGKVTVCCVGAAERLVKPDLPEGLTEVFDIMRLFQPVNRVKGKAKFSVIERCQFFADGMGLHRVIAYAVIVPAVFAVTFKG